MTRKAIGCRRAQQELSVRGKPNEALAIHLQQCPACRAFSADMHDILQGCAALGLDAPAFSAEQALELARRARQAVERDQVMPVSPQMLPDAQHLNYGWATAAGCALGGITMAILALWLAARSAATPGLVAGGRQAGHLQTAPARLADSGRSPAGALRSGHARPGPLLSLLAPAPSRQPPEAILPPDLRALGQPVLPPPGKGVIPRRGAIKSRGARPPGRRP